ncbi:MAG: phenylalanine--tRNA ligase subunit beta [Actinomycetota bacterium]
MKVSLDWLSELVPLDIDIPQLVDRLNMTGTKVEAVHGPADVEGIVVAEVLAIEPHPNADNLSMVEVSAGDDEMHRVVCGAKNFAVGDRIPFATVGSKLPGLTITERKIRGEVSRGMLCSASELGISKDSAGLLILQPDAPIGIDVVDLLGLGDTVLELEVTPNRPDCMGMIGVAREVAAVLGVEWEPPRTSLVAEGSPGPVSVAVEDETGCPRYLARYLEDVSVRPSPAWMARRLLAAGFRPISNIVDITNYVLLETGQPLHAFDADKVADQAIVVRRSRPGESLTTLDGNARDLDPADLLIADSEKALALAGVMGGESSEVSAATTRLILESAAFDKASVAYTSRRHGIRSEASARFERGSDPGMVPFAADRAAALIREHGGATVSTEAPDVYPGERERAVITLRPTRTEALLGMPIDPERQARHLRALGLEVADGRGGLEVRVPTFRPDLSIEADLIEEIARLEGYDKPSPTLPTGRSGALTGDQQAERHLKRALVMLGVTEVWTSSFMSPADLDAMGFDAEHPARRMILLSNPMLEQEPGLRTTLLPGLVKAAAHNVAQRAPGISLFEIGRTYLPSTGDLADEQPALAAVFAGNRSLDSWDGSAQPWDFFSAKGVLMAALGSLGIEGLSFDAIKGAPFHPTRAAQVSLGSVALGVIGELHPTVNERSGLPPGACALEIAIAPVMSARSARRLAEELPRFPAVYIDIAVVLDQMISASRVLAVIEESGKPHLTAVRLFDEYRGEQVPAGHKSLAFALELRHTGRTLTDEDAEDVRDHVVTSLAERFGAELRS